MHEHTIRLRTAWTLEQPPGTPSGRVDLPLIRLDLAGPFRLVRMWTVPPGLGPSEHVVLIHERCPGLREVRIDDVALPPTSPSPPLAPRGRRSRIVLDCDPTGLTDHDRDDWGHVALVVRSDA